MFREEIRRKVASYSSAANVQALRSKWRKVVTGDEKKRVRDMLMESQGKSEYVKLFDKLAFTVGVLNIGACQYFLLNLPGWFHVWYCVVLPLMTTARYFYFKMMNWEYFMLDFCYFTNLCILVDLLFLRWNWLSNICFIYSFGPLLMAIVLWRNSLVFHDFDKLMSIYIHMLPSMVSYVGRFHGHNYCTWSLPPLYQAANQCVMSTPLIKDSSITYVDFFLATVGYLLWQAAYFIKTEVLDKSKLDSRPEKLTSLRWLSKDLKNPFVFQIVQMARRLGVYGRHEEPDSTTVKTKLVFVTSQFLYTTSTFLLSYLVKDSAMASLLLIGVIYTVAVYYGASFYIEVFSTRYQWKFKSTTDNAATTAAAAATVSATPEVVHEDAVTPEVQPLMMVPMESESASSTITSGTGLAAEPHVSSIRTNFKAADYEGYFTPSDFDTLSDPPTTGGLPPSESTQALLWPE